MIRAERVVRSGPVPVLACEAVVGRRLFSTIRHALRGLGHHCRRIRLDLRPILVGMGGLEYRCHLLHLAPGRHGEGVPVEMHEALLPGCLGVDSAQDLDSLRHLFQITRRTA